MTVLRKVFAAGRLRDALNMAEHPALSAAVINLRLGADGTEALCRRLDRLGIPFIFCTRHDTTDARSKWPRVPVVPKPEASGAVVRTVAGVLHLGRRQESNHAAPNHDR